MLGSISKSLSTKSLRYIIPGTKSLSSKYLRGTKSLCSKSRMGIKSLSSKSLRGTKSLSSKSLRGIKSLRGTKSLSCTKSLLGTKSFCSESSHQIHPTQLEHSKAYLTLPHPTTTFQSSLQLIDPTLLSKRVQNP